MDHDAARKTGTVRLREAAAGILRTDSHNTAWVSDGPLFETAVRLLALKRHAPQRLDGELLAMLARRLVRAEVSVGGPYRDRDGRLDVAANVALLQFFAEYETSLPQTKDWAVRNAGAGDNGTGNDWVLSWPHRLMDNVTPPRSTRAATSAASATVRRAITQLPVDLQDAAIAMHAKVSRVDSDGEITGIARRFADSLADVRAVPAQTTDTLALANFYVWMAYTIYDGFIDDEGDPRNLPVANIVHRRAFSLYDGADTEPGLARRYFDAMDAANAWELDRCRFMVEDGTITVGRLPDYGDRTILARRAGAHVLGPLIILAGTGASDDVQATVSAALAQYLIARQLSDDLHDWMEDLAAGHISPVVAHLLRVCRIGKGPHILADIVPRLKRAFWDGELVRLSDEALAHIAAARSLETCGVLNPGSRFVREVIEPIGASLEAGKHVHEESRRFAGAYARSHATSV